MLSSIKNVEGVLHLIQKCRDDENMTYAMCAAYLKNAILIDYAIALKLSRLMHVNHTGSDGGKSSKQVFNMFHEMDKESGIKAI